MSAARFIFLSTVRLSKPCLHLTERLAGTAYREFFKKNETSGFDTKRHEPFYMSDTITIRSSGAIHQINGDKMVLIECQLCSFVVGY